MQYLWTDMALKEIERVEKSVLRYVRNKWIAPKNFNGIFFCALVGPDTLEHHRQQGKCRCFLPS